MNNGPYPMNQEIFKALILPIIDRFVGEDEGEDGSYDANKNREMLRDTGIEPKTQNRKVYKKRFDKIHPSPFNLCLCL